VYASKHEVPRRLRPVREVGMKWKIVETERATIVALWRLAFFAWAQCLNRGNAAPREQCVKVYYRANKGRYLLRWPVAMPLRDKGVAIVLQLAR